MFKKIMGIPEDEIISVTKISEPYDPKLKGIIIELIYKKINEVESNNFKPLFVVLSRKAYSSLIAHILETGNYYEAGIDGDFPTVIFGIPIVMVGDALHDVQVLSDSKHEFQYDVRRA